MIRRVFLQTGRRCGGSAASGGGLTLHVPSLSLVTASQPASRTTRTLTSSSSSSSAVNEESQSSQTHTVIRHPVVPFPQSPHRTVPSHIVRPPYADNGIVPLSQYPGQIVLHDDVSADRMRRAARLARTTLDLACSLAKPGVTTDEIDEVVHQAIINAGAYPSPLNYAGFPKSLCSSINEVICHGIPDTRPLQFGDIVSFDVSCYVPVHDDEEIKGVHGDNCATVIVGDEQEENVIGADWRGVPYLSHFDSERDEMYFQEARRLVRTTRESLYAGIEACRPGGCLSDVGAAIEDVADREGYSSVRKYRGHGISHEFHCSPFVKHFRNDERVELRPGMIFTVCFFAVTYSIGRHRIIVVLCTNIFDSDIHRLNQCCAKEHRIVSNGTTTGQSVQTTAGSRRNSNTPFS